MTVPLARAAFDFTLDDRVDLAVRSAQHLPSIRAQRRRSALLAGLLAALLMTALVWAVARPDRLSAANWSVVVLAGLIATTILHVRYPHHYRTAVRRILRDMYADAQAHCAVEVHADRLLFHQPEGVIAYAWTDILSMREEQGDLVFLTRRGTAIVRNRAFATEPERAAFVHCVRGLCPANG